VADPGEKSVPVLCNTSFLITALLESTLLGRRCISTHLVAAFLLATFTVTALSTTPFVIIVTFVLTFTGGFALFSLTVLA
jgi:hypothetical protein